MSEEDFIHTELNISDVIGDSEQFIDSEQGAENVESEMLPTDHDPEVIHSEEVHNSADKKAPPKSETTRSTKLPIARIKHIMKMDPDVSVLTADAVFLVTKATEMFLETIVKETYAITASNKRKVISKKDLDTVINSIDCLCFLEGAMDF